MFKKDDLKTITRGETFFTKLGTPLTPDEKKFGALLVRLAIECICNTTYYYFCINMYYF